MKRILFAAILFLAPCMAALSQTIRVEAPNLVSADEQFNVAFVIEGENAPSAFEWNPGDDFTLVWGPQKGSSTSFSIVNGKSSKTSQTTYTYVLMPRKAGVFTLSPATATVKGKTVSSGSTRIEVVAGGQGGRQGASQESKRPQSSAGSISDSDVYLRLSFSKNRVVVGETMTATLKLYQRVNIAGFEDARFPSFNGFWSQEMQAPTNINFRRENVGGEIFNTAVLRSWTLIPQKAGDITVDPAELVCLVNVRQASTSSGSIFDSFFQDGVKTVRKRVSTPATTLHVSPLPAGAPSSFSGGVGNFKISASLTRDSLKAHDAASLMVTISGSGNVSLLEAPAVSFPPDFEVYDIKARNGSGSKTFEYPFIPRSHGEFEIGPVEFSWYDIQAGRYMTASAGPMHLSVSRGEGVAEPVSGGGQLVPGVTRRDVKDLGSDIRFIETRMPKLRANGSFFVFSTAYWIVLAAILLISCALYFLLKGMAVRKADVVGSRNRGATKMARKRLSVAGEYMGRKLYTAFYEELHKALLGFVSDKFNLSASDMGKDNIMNTMEQAGVPAGMAESFGKLLDACEYARYAPDPGYEAMNAHYSEAVEVVADIDSALRRKPSGKVAGSALAMILMLIPAGAKASDSYTDSLWVAGTEAYSGGRWQDAARDWEAIASLGLVSPELYTNIGDALFKQDDRAGAILYYEKALKADPSYEAAKYNLAFANSLLQDKIDAVPEFFLTGWIRSAAHSLPSDAWAVLSLVLLAAALAMALLFLLGRRSSWRRTGFYSGVVLLLLSLMCLTFAGRLRRAWYSIDSAIVTKPVVAAKSAPGAGEGKDLFILHEGTKVRILDEVGQWRNIALSDGRQGWVEKQALSDI